MKKTIKGITYDTRKAKYIGGEYFGRGGWHGYSEAVARTPGGQYYVERTYALLDGRRLMPGDIPKELMGGVWDDKRFVEHHEIIPITCSEAVLRCLEILIPKDLRPELHKLIRSGKDLPPFRPSKY